jgi:peptidoglycan/xylan/chitin deacetylase (PgdA/CDA1 family)
MMRSRLGRDLLKAGIAWTFVGTGLLRLEKRARTRWRGARVHVLAYHRVVANREVLAASWPINPGLCVTVSSFLRQMQQLRKYCLVLPLHQAVQALSGELPLERDAWAITFDDGYRDVLAYAFPILQALELPATAFVPTGAAESGANLLHDRLYAVLWRACRSSRAPAVEAVAEGNPVLGAAYQAALAAPPGPAVDLLITTLPSARLTELTAALERLTGGPVPLDVDARVISPVEVRALADAGWEVGAHTVNHVALVHEAREQVVAELCAARAAIERWTQRPCRYFAYCNGLHDTATEQAVRHAGYLGAFTTFDRPNYPGGNMFRLSRKCLNEGHARGPGGRFSDSVSLAHLHDLFGDLRLTRPIEGTRA